MANKNKEAKIAEAEPRFGKRQLINSERYKSIRDLTCALLEDDKTYTLSEVDKLTEDWLKGKVI